MPASYPASIKSFTTKTNLVDLVDAAHVNDLQLEVNAIETELGVNVSETAADLKTRLAVCLAGNGAVVNSPSFPGSSTAMQLFYHSTQDKLNIRNAANSAWVDLTTRTATAGSILQSLSGEERTVNTPEGATKVKSIIVPFPGTYTIKFDLKSTDGTARIYRNGSAVGTDRSESSGVFVEYSENIAGWSAGDTCELYVDPASANTTVRNFGIYVGASSGTAFLVNLS